MAVNGFEFSNALLWAPRATLPCTSRNNVWLQPLLDICKALALLTHGHVACRLH